MFVAAASAAPAAAPPGSLEDGGRKAGGRNSAPDAHARRRGEVHLADGAVGAEPPPRRGLRRRRPTPRRRWPRRRPSSRRPSRRRWPRRRWPRRRWRWWPRRRPRPRRRRRRSGRGGRRFKSMRGGVQRAPKSHAVPHTHVEASPPPHPSASLQVVIAISLIFHALISICQTLHVRLPNPFPHRPVAQATLISAISVISMLLLPNDLRDPFAKNDLRDPFAKSPP